MYSITEKFHYIVFDTTSSAPGANQVHVDFIFYQIHYPFYVPAKKSLLTIENSYYKMS